MVLECEQKHQLVELVMRLVDNCDVLAILGTCGVHTFPMNLGLSAWSGHVEAACNGVDSADAAYSSSVQTASITDTHPAKVKWRISSTLA